MKVRLLTVSTAFANEKEVALIRLKGKWLEQLGFRNGNKVIVEEKYGEITIRLIEIKTCEGGMDDE